MINAKAVIASCVGGIPEMIFHNKNGLLVEPNNINDLANSIERLATDWSLANRLGSEGRKMMTDQYALPSHLERLLEFYDQSIQSQRVVKNPSYA
jgi:glycosyltransferase involved in cell wall biosynthesis